MEPLKDERVVDLAGLDDVALWALAGDIAAEQRRRCLESGDTEAVVEHGYTTGFDTKGHARDPVLAHGFVICHGSVVEKSASSHDCRFVHVGDDWVWECPDTIVDDVRKIADRGRLHQRSVSLLAPVEGLELDFITSTMRQGAHRMVRTMSYRIDGGQLELIQSRVVKDVHHRR
jgi:hypothetical protein